MSPEQREFQPDFLDFRMVEFYLASRLSSSKLSPEELAKGTIFSPHFLIAYLDLLSRLDGYTSANDPYEWEDLCLERVLGFYPTWRSLRKEIVGNWLEALSSLSGKDWEVPERTKSSKVGSHLVIAQRLEGAVLLTGKLEGTRNHMGAIDYLAKKAPVVLGIEPNRYSVWEKETVNSQARRYPLIRDTVRLSLWAYHPRISAVFLVPSAWHESDEEADEFYDNLFEETGVTFSCAVEGDPNLEKKLKRGKKPAGEDWRVIPRFSYPSTSEVVRIG